MDRITLQATPRTVLGKKVRFMRRNGIIPVNVFGHNVESLALQIEVNDLERALARAGTNTLMNLSIAGSEDVAPPVLIRGYQRKVTTGQLLHVDLYRVSMTEKLTTEVPLEFTGVAAGVDLGGVIFHNLNALEIECLPNDLVSSIVVDLSPLTEIDASILVSDVKVPQGITVLTQPETLVVKVMPPQKEEEEAAPEAEAAPGAEAEAPAEGAAATE